MLTSLLRVDDVTVKQSADVDCGVQLSLFIISIKKYLSVPVCSGWTVSTIILLNYKF